MFYSKLHCKIIASWVYYVMSCWNWLRQALCRTTFLPVTNVLVDMWMLTVSQFSNLGCLITWNGLQTQMWHHLHSLLRHNWQYGFGRPILLFHFFIHPPIFLPVHNKFYPSKWQLDWSLHEVMDSGISHVVLLSIQEPRFSLLINAIWSVVTANICT